MIFLKLKNGGRTTSQSHDERLCQGQNQLSLQCRLPSKGPRPLQRYSSQYLEFIVRLSDKANVMCEQNNKKTISAEHLEAALTVTFFFTQEFGLTDHLNELRNLEGAIKEQNQLKREASQRMEEMLARDLEE